MHACIQLITILQYCVMLIATCVWAIAKNNWQFHGPQRERERENNWQCKGIFHRFYLTCVLLSIAWKWMYVCMGRSWWAKEWRGQREVWRAAIAKPPPWWLPSCSTVKKCSLVLGWIDRWRDDQDECSIDRAHALHALLSLSLSLSLIIEYSSTCTRPSYLCDHHTLQYLSKPIKVCILDGPS